jgi:hypothetical protein
LEGIGVSQFTVGSAAARATIVLRTTLEVVLAEFAFEANWSAAASTHEGCGVRVSPTIPVLLRLSRPDRIANYDKLDGKAYAGL